MGGEVHCSFLVFLIKNERYIAAKLHWAQQPVRAASSLKTVTGAQKEFLWFCVRLWDLIPGLE